MKTIILSDNDFDLKRVFPEYIVAEICKSYDCDGKFYNKKSVERGEVDKSTEAVFTTWGMPKFSAEEVRKFFPNLKYIFYSAGSVQHFARPFLESGVRVFSSWKANAVPVAEYTVAQIILANKGYFKSAKKFYPRGLGVVNSLRHKGNFNAKVGLLGVGGVGALVAKGLQSMDIELYAYDPFLSDERANELNIKKVELEWMFANCDVVSNHLANKPELDKIINYKLLKSMPKYSTFINTGRGAQVDERHLAKVLRKDKTKVAVLDVTTREPLSFFSPLRWCGNAVLTPHIAGSTGEEVVRMSKLMIATCGRVLSDESVDNEVTLDMLSSMA